jgi:hypothetical protein
MKLLTSPEKEDIRYNDSPSIFLAGSIEMGHARPWHQEVIDAMQEEDVVILNPRRKEWDATWHQSMDNPVFAEQVNWELDYLYLADIAFFYFQANTKSPISLAELGFVLGTGRDRTDTVVVCESGFWRKGNVNIMCH